MALKSKKLVRKIVNSAEVSTEASILSGVLQVLDSNKNWSGTMTDLRSDLIRRLGRKALIPGSPSALRMVLNKVVSRLRRHGVSVKFGRTSDHMRTRYVKFAR